MDVRGGAIARSIGKDGMNVCRFERLVTVPALQRSAESAAMRLYSLHELIVFGLCAQ
jgi:hypothetical protein